MLPRFERFIQERKYLKNVSPRTIEWYEQSLAWLTVDVQKSLWRIHSTYMRSIHQIRSMAIMAPMM